MQNKQSKSFSISPKASGFTLIELLVSMAILGLLVSLVGRNYINVKRKSRDAQRKHDLEQIQRALEMYYNDYEQYPDTRPADPGNAWEDANGTLYIKAWPQDPKNYSYYYESSDNHSYKVFAYLENDRDPDIETCVIGLRHECGGGGESKTCNYGVSSVNLGVCD